MKIAEVQITPSLLPKLDKDWKFALMASSQSEGWVVSIIAEDGAAPKVATVGIKKTIGRKKPSPPKKPPSGSLPGFGRAGRVVGAGARKGLTSSQRKAREMPTQRMQITER